MRRIFPEKFRLLGGLALLLLTGFLATTAASYLVARQAIHANIINSALPLTGDNIYSEVQKDLLRPVFISSLMAHDTFVRDWLLHGEQGRDNIVRYLAEVKQKYGTITSFLVSDATHRYYYADGLLKTVAEKEPRDLWFFRVRAMQDPYETNVDIDMANHDAMTIFINYRVLDYDGRFIGATGVGLTLDTMSRLIDSYESRFHRLIYFTDDNGRIMLAGRTLQRLRTPITQAPGISTVAGRILQRNLLPVQLNYRGPAGTMLVNARFIPELGWHLVVEQNEDEALLPLRHMLVLNIAVAVGVTLLVLLVAWLAIRGYQTRLERMATHDVLTGCLNRQAFEIVVKSFMREAARSQKPLSAILFDVDYFKRINDSEGHQAGDKVLQRIAALVQDILRESDVVARWGGEEFMVLLNDCRQEMALQLAENLRLRIATHDFSDITRAAVTVSLGVAQHGRSESETAFFSRIDNALYLAKENGRNRCEVAGTPA